MNVTMSRRSALAAAAALLGGALILSSSPASGAPSSLCTDLPQISVGSVAVRLETAVHLPAGFSKDPLGASHESEALRQALAGVACAAPAPPLVADEMPGPALTGVKSSNSPNCAVL